MYSKVKTILYKYFIENRCKYSSDTCLFAHGEENMTHIECKFANNCNNAYCLFDHGRVNINKTVIYEPVIRYKNNNKNFGKKSKNSKIFNNIKNKDILISNIGKIDNLNNPGDKKINNSIYKLEGYYINILKQKDDIIYNLKKKNYRTKR